MKLDTSSYYPKSPLCDDGDDEPQDRLSPSQDRSEHPHPEEERLEEVVITETSEVEIDEDEVRDDIGMEQLPQESSRAVTAVSHLLSWVLVPMMMPVYGVLLAFNLSILHYTTFGQKAVFTLIVAAINIGIPALAVLLLKKIGMVQDVGLNRRKERTVPYIVTILCMAGTAFFMYAKGAPMWTAMFFAGGALAGLVELCINFRWKISAHSAGMAGIVALLLRIMQDGVPQPGLLTWLMITIALTGMLGSARIWLGRHTIWQVSGGYVVGFCSVYFLTMIH